jgi:hypothetical protein
VLSKGSAVTGADWVHNWPQQLVIANMALQTQAL